MENVRVLEHMIRSASVCDSGSKILAMFLAVVTQNTHSEVLRAVSANVVMYGNRDINPVWINLNYDTHITSCVIVFNQTHFATSSIDPLFRDTSRPAIAMQMKRFDKYVTVVIASAEILTSAGLVRQGFGTYDHYTRPELIVVCYDYPPRCDYKDPRHVLLSDVWNKVNSTPRRAISRAVYDIGHRLYRRANARLTSAPMSY
ncbi:hypothetical protein EVAR_2224_1 [Eumeta japonica]|uniref:Uncharacterized protein n=1 Tax=Eumeta variegata TaxID=151549 RepID=A0A4C1SI69_EUMVA|nr:hypothetical protein EVAR_2224_1 [Eumeta japonica]